MTTTQTTAPKTTTRKRTPAKTGSPVADRKANAEVAKVTPAVVAKTTPAKAAPAAPKVTPPATASKPGLPLEFVLVNGDFRVHKSGCKDVPRDLAKSDYQEPGRMNAETQREAILDLWDDQIRESAEDGDNPTDEELGQYIGATDFAPCTKKLTPLAVAAPKPTKSDAKTDLGRRAVLALDAMFAGLEDSDLALTGWTREEAAQCLANWVHHFPVGRNEAGRTWPATTLPKPDRSDWL